MKEGRKSKRKSTVRNVRGRDGGERKERKKAEKTGIFSCLLPICEGTLGTISDKAMMQSP